MRIIATLIMLMPIIASAKPAIVDSEMTVLWSGIPAARWEQKIEVDDNGYKINGTARTIGVVAVLFNANAGFKINGEINNNKVTSKNTELTFRANRQDNRLTLEFENEKLIKQTLTPERKEPEETGRIPVEAEHLINVIDPFAALVLPVEPQHIGNGKKICEQNLEVFDGRRRMKLEFSYKSQRDVAMAGHDGKVFVCNVRFIPIAGHRQDSRSTKFMAENKEIEVSLTQIGNTPYYTLFSFSSPLLRGTLTILPRRFATQ